jgi:curved DNA-binding protein CbpA
MDGRRARNVLGVDRDAGPDEIRRAFRARALVTHPDHGGDDLAFTEVMDALAALRSAEPRRPMFRALPKTGPRVDVYDSAPRSQPRRDFADVLRAAAARLG